MWESITPTQALRVVVLVLVDSWAPLAPIGSLGWNLGQLTVGRRPLGGGGGAVGVLGSAESPPPPLRRKHINCVDDFLGGGGAIKAVRVCWLVLPGVHTFERGILDSWIGEFSANPLGKE